MAANGYLTVNFSPEEQQRYAALGIKTAMKDKAKALMQEFCDKEELARIDRERFLSHPEIERLMQEQLMKVTKATP